ncbi:Uncharacterized protein TCM_034650 [Theobroma cacao]|uniref:Uncharacterized protein n=1 Tax=Theobroma cacao TaxID=3641 RepID=A0A061FG61_THECC|nr:Uncharacterized protein TCM_034650 [Theobroma cacao]
MTGYVKNLQVSESMMFQVIWISFQTDSIKLKVWDMAGPHRVDHSGDAGVGPRRGELGACLTRDGGVAFGLVSSVAFLKWAAATAGNPYQDNKYGIIVHRDINRTQPTDLMVQKGELARTM